MHAVVVWCCVGDVAKALRAVPLAPVRGVCCSRAFNPLGHGVSCCCLTVV